MTTLIRLAAAALVIALSGCGVVYSPHPVGETPAQIDPKEWEGTWIGPEGETLVVKVADRENAVLRIAGVDWTTDKPQLGTVTAHLRVSGDWTFISFPKVGASCSSGDLSDTWGRIERGGEMAVFWAPDAREFGPLVAEGILPGEYRGASVFGSDVHLGSLTSDHMAIITSEKHGMLFHWDKPLIYRRIAR